jgi:mRNA interferase MazF
LKRGEIWWARLDERRPVVLLSRDEAYEIRSMIVVAPTTSRIRGYAVEVKLGRREGLSRECVVNCDWIVTIAKMDLIEKAGSLASAKLQQLDAALRFALSLD